MQSTLYYNEDFLLIRKPHGIPSTFGKEESFLDILQKSLSENIITWTPLSELVPADIFPFVSSHLGDFKLAEDPADNLRHQVDTFGQEQEFGLLHRLDNDTAGFLYFARHPKAFAHFQSLQKANLVKKFYIVQVEGDVRRENGDMRYVQNSKSKIQNPKSKTPNLNIPIMHHKSNPEKMLAIRHTQDLRLGRGRQHHVSTEVDILHYDDKTRLTTILATITRGIRHQIRVHLASQGTPIVGDILYGKGGGLLHLWSIGFQMP